MGDVLPSQLETLVATRDGLVSVQSRLVDLNRSNDARSVGSVELGLNTTAHGLGLLISKMREVLGAGVESNDGIDLPTILGDVERTLADARRTAMEFELFWPEED